MYDDLLNFETDTFKYKLYSETPEELTMIKDFAEDSSIQEYLGDYYNYIMETKQDIDLGIEPLRYTSIIYKDNLPVGILTFFNNNSGDLIFSHGISPSARGNRYSSIMKTEVFDYVFKNHSEINSIITYIDINNSNNINSLKKLEGYSVEEVNDSNNNKTYYKVSHSNPYTNDIKNNQTK